MPDIVRAARPEDRASLLRLWQSLYDEVDPAAAPEWTANAGRWFATVVGDDAQARVVVGEAAGEVVATAIGTLEPGVPNPFCPTGLTARLANVITRPEYRGRGLATALVQDVVAWARSRGADRLDLSATESARSVYERLGFVPTSAPRMKLVL
jgi:GNAT superfamily N-acetyltransferase